MRTSCNNSRIPAVGLALMFSLCLWPAAADQQLGFAPGASNEFTFDTGVLRGKLRAGGKSVGLSSVVHIPSGLRLDHSMGLFSHYRVFSSGKRYGTAAWDWPSQARLKPDGAVEVSWPATDRPFELRALYHWSASNVLDLETSVRAQTDLPKFESFLASYFTEAFTNASVYAKPAGDSAGAVSFLPLEKSAGTWQVFPKDSSMLSLIQDGRWKIEPNPVDWVVRPPLAAPVCTRRAAANGVTVVLMGLLGDCFAISAPYESEPHYSMYLSLFGRDLRPGETATARSRLVFGTKLTNPEIVALYEAFRRQAR